MKKYIKERFKLKFPDSNFKKQFKKYNKIKDFAPDSNVFETQEINEEQHFIMRTATQYHINEAFKAMKVDLTDPNVKEDLGEGNISTPGRIAKVWCGDGIHDDRELGGGRWSVKPRLASFPNKNKENNIPITKRVDIISNCSHHFIPFTSLQREDSYAIISYIPKDKVLGISKLQRVADHISQRFWLQENLTEALYKEVQAVAETDSVYVGLFNIVHGCESNRGAKSKDGAFSSEFYGGDFNNSELRQSIKQGK